MFICAIILYNTDQVQSYISLFRKSSRSWGTKRRRKRKRCPVSMWTPQASSKTEKKRSQPSAACPVARRPRTTREVGVALCCVASLRRLACCMCLGTAATEPGTHVRRAIWPQDGQEGRAAKEKREEMPLASAFTASGGWWASLQRVWLLVLFLLEEHTISFFKKEKRASKMGVI